LRHITADLGGFHGLSLSQRNRPRGQDLPSADSKSSTGSDNRCAGNLDGLLTVPIGYQRLHSTDVSHREVADAISQQSQSKESATQRGRLDPKAAQSTVFVPPSPAPAVRLGGKPIKNLVVVSY
jgi:hypothetical protein